MNSIRIEYTEVAPLLRAWRRGWISTADLTGHYLYNEKYGPIVVNLPLSEIYTAIETSVKA